MQFVALLALHLASAEGLKFRRRENLGWPCALPRFACLITCHRCLINIIYASIKMVIKSHPEGGGPLPPAPRPTQVPVAGGASNSRGPRLLRSSEQARLRSTSPLLLPRRQTAASR